MIEQLYKNNPTNWTEKSPSVSGTNYGEFLGPIALVSWENVNGRDPLPTG